MQVGEVGFRTGRAFQRLHVGGQLDQIAGHEPGREAQVAQHLHQQPGGIATGPFAGVQGFFRRQDTRFHADDVVDALLHPHVQRDQHVHRALFVAADPGQEVGQQRAGGFQSAERRQFLVQHMIVCEREGLRLRFQEEVERIDGDHIRHQVDGDDKPVDLFRENRPRQMVALRVLLPIDEMRLRLDLQCVGQDRGACMRRRTQADGLRPEGDQPVVMIGRAMGQGDVQRHIWLAKFMNALWCAAPRWNAIGHPPAGQSARWRLRLAPFGGPFPDWGTTVRDQVGTGAFVSVRRGKRVGMTILPAHPSRADDGRRSRRSQAGCIARGSLVPTVGISPVTSADIDYDNWTWPGLTPRPSRCGYPSVTSDLITSSSAVMTMPLVSGPR